MSLPRYPIYKDSVVIWLGEVPAHWDVYPLKRELDFLTSGSRGWAEHYSDDGALFLRIGNLTRDSIRLDLSDIQRVDIPDGAEGARTRVKPGDVLFSITAYLGSVAVVPEGIEPAFVSQHVALARLKEKGSVLPAWSAYVALSWIGKTYLETTGYGGTKVQLSLDDVANLLLTVPPLTEQSVITAFLDRETAKIDALIAEQEKLIALLAEKRQATISRAVTRGFDPNVQLKDSGVLWLGKVPAHWEVLAFQRCVDVAEGQVNPEEEPYRSMILVAPNHVESGTGRLLFTETAEEQSAESGKYLCQSGDVIYSKIRPALRKVCIAPQDCLCSADMYPLRGSVKLDNDFLMWFMLSEPFSALAVLESERVAMPKINRESLKVVSIALPPKSEQMAIVEFLVSETGSIDALVAKVKSAIELLKERRAALISAAVTGKIDVRQSQD